MLTAFKPTYIAVRAMDFVNLIVASEDDGIEIKKNEIENIITLLSYVFSF